MYGFTLVFVCVGLLFAGLAIPLMQRKVAPNVWYGLRVPATFADEGVWYEANARSGRDLFLLGVVQVFLALLLPLAPVAEVTYVFVNTGVLLFGTILMAVVGWRRANRMLAERELPRLGSVRRTS